MIDDLIKVLTQNGITTEGLFATVIIAGVAIVWLVSRVLTVQSVQDGKIEASQANALLEIIRLAASQVDALKANTTAIKDSAVMNSESHAEQIKTLQAIATRIQDDGEVTNTALATILNQTDVLATTTLNIRTDHQETKTMIIEVKERLERIEKSIEMLTTLLETVIEAIKQQRTQSDKTIEVLDSAKIVTQEIGVTIKNEVHELEEKAK